MILNIPAKNKTLLPFVLTSSSCSLIAWFIVMPSYCYFLISRGTDRPVVSFIVHVSRCESIFQIDAWVMSVFWANVSSDLIGSSLLFVHNLNESGEVPAPVFLLGSGLALLVFCSFFTGIFLSHVSAL